MTTVRSPADPVQVQAEHEYSSSSTSMSPTASTSPLDQSGELINLSDDEAKPNTRISHGDVLPPPPVPEFYASVPNAPAPTPTLQDSAPPTFVPIAPTTGHNTVDHASAPASQPPPVAIRPASEARNPRSEPVTIVEPALDERTMDADTRAYIMTHGFPSGHLAPRSAPAAAGGKPVAVPSAAAAALAVAGAEYDFPARSDAVSPAPSVHNGEDNVKEQDVEHVEADVDPETEAREARAYIIEHGMRTGLDIDAPSGRVAFGPTGTIAKDKEGKRDKIKGKLKHGINKIKDKIYTNDAAVIGSGSKEGSIKSKDEGEDINSHAPSSASASPLTSTLELVAPPIKPTLDNEASVLSTTEPTAMVLKDAIYANKTLHATDFEPVRRAPSPHNRDFVKHPIDHTAQPFMDDKKAIHVNRSDSQAVRDAVWDVPSVPEEGAPLKPPIMPKGFATEPKPVAASAWWDGNLPKRIIIATIFGTLAYVGFKSYDKCPYSGCPHETYETAITFTVTWLAVAAVNVLRPAKNLATGKDWADLLLGTTGTVLAVGIMSSLLKGGKGVDDMTTMLKTGGEGVSSMLQKTREGGVAGLRKIGRAGTVEGNYAAIVKDKAQGASSRLKGE